MSPQIGSRFARVARSSASRSLFAFGIVRSWGSTSPSPARDGSVSAPMIPWVWRRAAVVVGELHLVAVERGLGVAPERAVGLPRRELAAAPS